MVEVLDPVPTRTTEKRGRRDLSTCLAPSPDGSRPLRPLRRPGLHPRDPAHGGELLFCGHHGHAHENKLREMSVDFQDDSSQLVETPATAPDPEH